jgi:glycosyltransferase involved in cell wall biosynthesis
MADLKISIVICTYNPREDYLNRVLNALRQQTLPMENWELLVIDNASRLPVSERFDISWCLHGRHLQEEKPGKLNAWLLGIKESQSDILVFVDDDNVLAKDYLVQALLISSQWPFIGAWGGSIIPEYEKPLPAWVGSNVWRLTVLDVKEDIWSNLREDFTTIPVGAGLCVRSTVAKKYLERCHQNPVSAKLDRAGAGLGGYGDIDLSCCAMDLGMGTGRSIRLRLTHLIAAGRLTLDYFVRHAEGDAVSMMLFRASRGLSISEPKSLTVLDSLRWFVHRIIHHVPREQYQIAKAHQRGLEKGWQQVCDFRKAK